MSILHFMQMRKISRVVAKIRIATTISGSSPTINGQKNAVQHVSMSTGMLTRASMQQSALKKEQSMPEIMAAEVGNPRLTIGMPVFNGERWLAETFDSLLRQTFRDFEIIVSDNCSTDETRNICLEYANRDSRIHYIRQDSNIGIFRNYDAVFHESKTPFFKWASSNDLCRPRFLELCMNALDEHPDAVLSCTHTVLFDEDAQKESEYVENIEWHNKDPIARYREFWSKAGLNNVMNGVIRSDALRRTMLNMSFQGSDLNMIADLLLQGPAIIVDEPLFYRRMAPSASTAAKSKTEHDEFFSQEPVQAVYLQRTKRLWFAMIGAIRAPKKLRTKMRAFAYALRRIVRNRREILREVAEYSRR